VGGGGQAEIDPWVIARLDQDHCPQFQRQHAAHDTLLPKTWIATFQKWDSESVPTDLVSPRLINEELFCKPQQVIFFFLRDKGKKLKTFVLWECKGQELGKCLGRVRITVSRNFYPLPRSCGDGETQTYVDVAFCRTTETCCILYQFYGDAKVKNE